MRARPAGAPTDAPSWRCRAWLLLPRRNDPSRARQGALSAHPLGHAVESGTVEERHALSRVVTERASQDLTLARSDDLAKFNADDLRMARAIRAKAAQMMARVNFPADLRALASAVDTAQKIGRLALGASTENATVSTRELPASVDEFV